MTCSTVCLLACWLVGLLSKIRAGQSFNCHALSKKEKRKIASEAFTDAKKVKATAWTYNIQPAHICHWKHSISTMNNKSTKHIGSAKKILPVPEPSDHLKQYFEQLHEEGHVVSVNMLVVELCHDHKYVNLNLQMLWKSIVRYLEEQSIIYCYATHVAQNHHFNAAVIANWT